MNPICRDAASQTPNTPEQQAQQQSRRPRTPSEAEVGPATPSSNRRSLHELRSLRQAPSSTTLSDASANEQTNGNDTRSTTSRDDSLYLNRLFDDDVRIDATLVESPPGHESWVLQRNTRRRNAAAPTQVGEPKFLEMMDP